MSATSGMAALPFPVAEPSSPTSSVFLKLLSLLGGDTAEQAPEDEVDSSPVQTANSQAIADAVIRSMLRSGASTVATPLAQTVDAGASVDSKSSKGEAITDVAIPADEEAVGVAAIPDTSPIAGGTKAEIIPALPAPRERKESQKCGHEPRVRSANTAIESAATITVQASAPALTPKAATPPTTDNAQSQLAAPTGSAVATTSGRESSSAPLAFALRLTPRDSPGTTDPPNQTDQNFSITPRQSKQDTSSDAQSSGSGGEQTKENSGHPRFSEIAAVVAETPSVDVANSTNPAIVVGGSGHLETAPNRSVMEIPTIPSPEAPVDLAPQTPKSSSAHEIAVRVSGPDQSSVDLHIAQRGGEVRVAVRTADGGLQTSLYNDLGTLVDRLDRAGFHTETIAATEGSSTNRLDAGLDRSNGAGHLATHPVETMREFSSNDSGSRDGSSNSNADERSSNQGNSGGRQQQQQQQRRQNAPEARWRQTLEETL